MSKSLKKHSVKHGNLTFNFKSEWSRFFGKRDFIEIIKECKSIPGLAPEYYDNEVGQIVESFKDNDEPYLIFDNPPNLNMAEMEIISDIMKEPYDPRLYPTKEELREFLEHMNQDD